LGQTYPFCAIRNLLGALKYVIWLAVIFRMIFSL
jgi:hypothetical protein